jgi:glycosyltransferase involved in cell wall biosynthesis
MMRKKTVIHLLSTWQVSGAENVAIEIIKVLKSDYNFIYVSPQGTIQQSLKNEEIEYIPLKKMSLLDIWKLKKKVKPDLVHAHDVRATVLSRLVFGSKNVVSHLHVNPKDMNKLSLKSLMYIITQIKIPKIIIVNKTIENDFVFSNLIKKKIHHIRNIIDGKSIMLKADSQSAEKFDIVFIGRLSDQKDPLRAIEIFRQIVKKNSNIKMAMLGDGPLYEMCKLEIQKYNLEDKIKLLGFQSNPYPILKRGSLLLMTSKFEGYPMVALESLALGIPIVSTPVDGMKDIIADDINGKLIESNSVFINYIISILNDAKFRESLSTNSKKIFSEINSVDTFKDNINDIYKGYFSEGKHE